MTDPNMDGAYGKSRSELLSWLNSTLSPQAAHAIGGSITQVEQCGSGVPYLFLLPQIFPGNTSAAAAPSKAKLPARQEYDSLVNLKLLQDVFTKNQVNRVIDIPKMSKRNFQSNLEFLQWFRWLYESRVAGGGSSGGAANGSSSSTTAVGMLGSSPQTATRGRPVTASPGAALSQLRRAPGSTVSSARGGVGATRPATGGATASSRTSDAGAARARSLSASSRGASAPGSTVLGPTSSTGSRAISPLRSKSPSLYPTSSSSSHAPGSAPFLKNIRGVRAVTPTRGPASATTMAGRSPMHSSRSTATTSAASQQQETTTYIELERRFYYDKLRAIEDVVRNHEAKRAKQQLEGSVEGAAEQPYEALLCSLQKILYATH